MLGRPQSALGRALLLLAALWLMGLGGGTEGGAGSSIPIPQQNFTVTVADRSGHSLEAKRFTWEGKVEFRGQLGNATVSLPFSKVKSVRVQPANGDKTPGLITATITLRSGESVSVGIDRSTKCYGETKFGNYEIFFKDIASIEFH